MAEFTASLKQYDYDWHMYSANKPNYVILTPEEKPYQIDLNSRTIYGPSVLSVEDDHNAELIIFEVDRYYEYVDLADMCCIIQFKTNKKNKEPFIGIYPVRYYDIVTKPDKILIPWSIPHSVTQSAQTIEYNFRFFKMEKQDEAYKLVYNLNTLSAEAQILDSLNVYSKDLNNVYNVEDIEYNDEIFTDSRTTAFEQLVQMYKDLYNTKQLYWETPDTISSQTYNNDFLNEDS